MRIKDDLFRLQFAPKLVAFFGVVGLTTLVYLNFPVEVKQVVPSMENSSVSGSKSAITRSVAKKTVQPISCSLVNPLVGTNCLPGPGAKEIASEEDFTDLHYEDEGYDAIFIGEMNKAIEKIQLDQFEEVLRITEQLVIDSKPIPLVDLYAVLTSCEEVHKSNLTPCSWLNLKLKEHVDSIAVKAGENDSSAQGELALLYAHKSLNPALSSNEAGRFRSEAISIWRLLSSRGDVQASDFLRDWY